MMIMSIETCQNKETVWVQIVAIVIACLSAVTYGLILGWTSPFIEKLTTDKVNYSITTDQASLITYIPPVAMMVSCTFFSMLSDKIGRKRTLMLIVIPHCLSWICTVVSRNIYVFYAARIFSGAAVGCLLVTLPVYIGEIAIPKIRGTWGNLIALGTFLGIFLINVIGSQCSLHLTTYICLPLPLIFVFLMYFLPESPYWYIMHKREQEAKKSLRIFRGIEDVDIIFNNLLKEIDKQMKERGTWKDLLTVPENRCGLIAGVFLRISQLFGGVGAMMNYAQFIFANLDLDIPSEIPAIVFTGTCLGLLFISGYIIERFGKKKCFIISNFLNGIVLILEAVYFYLDIENLNNLRWFPIVGMVLYAIFTSFGNIPIPNLMLGELFSTNIKAKGLSVLIIIFGFVFFASNLIFYQLESNVGIWSAFLFFGISNFLSSIFAYNLLPETAGKTLEEIQKSLK